MPSVTNRQTFKEYCLRKLGFPTIEINLDDDQVEDRIDDAFQYWQDYHFDALQKVYYIKKWTPQTWRTDTLICHRMLQEIQATIQ